MFERLKNKLSGGQNPAQPGGKKKKKKDGAEAATRNTSIEDGREYKLVVMGEGGVGKTAITIQFMNNKFVAEYDPTIEDAYRKEYTINDNGTEKNIVVEIIDTAGQEEFSQGLHDKFIRQGEGFILVYSITASSSFEKIKEIRDKILWVKDMPEVPMIFVGNKRDLEKERKVDTETAAALAAQCGCPFLETSAKTGENVVEAIDLLLFEVAKSGYVADSGVMKRPGAKARQ